MSDERKPTKTRRQFAMRWLDATGANHCDLETNAGLVRAIEMARTALSVPESVGDGYKVRADELRDMLEDLCMVLDVDKEVGGMNFTTKTEGVIDKMTLEDFFDALPDNVVREFKDIFGMTQRESRLPYDPKGPACVPVEIILFHRAAEKIWAIKYYRERVGCGLKQAKDAVEASLSSQLPWADKHLNEQGKTYIDELQKRRRSYQ